ncbi:DUF922 domain-containing protein [Candidatus Woesearchaeota archaeon]|nr:DUF922 domain-containing protein [Candidatus Woesearchaeota archaeon]
MKIQYILLLIIFLMGCTGQTVYVHPTSPEQEVEEIEIIPPPDPIPMNVPETFPGLWVRVDTRYYYIDGNTTQDLTNEMQLKGPRIPRYDHNSAGAATWDIEKRHTTLQDSNGCKINQDEIQAYVPVLIDLPKWVNYDKVSQAEKNSWNKYLIYLHTHEKTHADITIKYAKEYVTYLRNLGYFASCDELNKHVDEYYNTMRRNLEREQSQYDEDEKNGNQS